MSRLGISDPFALATATRIGRRAGVGYFLAAIACNMGRAAGYDHLVAPQAFALAFGYAFFGVALSTAGRRRMLMTVPSTGTVSRLFTLTMLGFGMLLLFGSGMTIFTLASMVLSLM